MQFNPDNIDQIVLRSSISASPNVEKQMILAYICLQYGFSDVIKQVIGACGISPARVLAGGVYEHKLYPSDRVSN